MHMSQLATSMPVKGAECPLAAHACMNCGICIFLAASVALRGRLGIMPYLREGLGSDRWGHSMVNVHYLSGSVRQDRAQASRAAGQMMD